MTDYKLQRLKRKTLTLTIKDGNVFVKAPLNMSGIKIEKFIAKHEQWISKKLESYWLKQEKFARLLAYDEVMIFGKPYYLEFSQKNKKITMFENFILIPVKYYSGLPNQDNAHLKKALQLWLKKFAYNELNARLINLSLDLNIKYNQFSLTNAKSKWGSCDSKNNIKLNWRLIMLENKLSDYVIIHELCHIFEHNHSKKFWEKVSNFFPQYKSARKDLKSNSTINELFR